MTLTLLIPPPDRIIIYAPAAFSSGLWNIPTPIDQVLDGHVVQTHVEIDRMLHLLYQQGPLGTVCLQQDSDNVCHRLETLESNLYIIDVVVLNYNN